MSLTPLMYSYDYFCVFSSKFDYKFYKNNIFTLIDERKDFKIVELEDTVVYSISKQYERQDHNAREGLHYTIWMNHYEDISGQLCEGSWNQLGNTAYDGVWH